MEERSYYTAYEERYKTIHERGVSWAGENATPIVGKVLEERKLERKARVLEIGCGEGRDAEYVLRQGYELLATDVSPEAIRWCREKLPEHEKSFRVLDCLKERLEERFDFIYSVAVIHMLVRDEDRKRFYRFVRVHLKPDGIALICTMGDGETQFQSDIRKAFTLQERSHATGTIAVAATSCRMVSFEHFERELKDNELKIEETGITSAMPDFDRLMYAVVSRA